jgi:hypothetical protein
MEQTIDATNILLIAGSILRGTLELVSLEDTITIAENCGVWMNNNENGSNSSKDDDDGPSTLFPIHRPTNTSSSS